MLWRCEHTLRRAYFHGPSRIKNQHAVRKTRQEPRIVRDQNHREPQCLPKSPEESKDFLLGCGVKRGRGLVGEDEGGTASDRLRHKHALPLTAAQLVGIGVCDAVGIRGEQRREHLARPVSARCEIQRFVRSQDFLDLITHTHRGMKSNGRLLKYE